MRIQDVMTHNVVCVRPRDSLADAARIMKESNVGILPVINDGHLCGVITDRDIAVGCDSVGCSAKRKKVEALMTRDVHCCHDDDEVGAVLATMAREHLRRMPVLLHRMYPRLIGMISIDDLADAAEDARLVKQVLATGTRARSAAPGDADAQVELRK